MYRLIDPRNGETFYVGKGKNDRLFEHVKELKLEKGQDEESAKLKRIRAIRAEGFEVGHIIHRHGMEDRVAGEVEKALLDAYPGLTNVARDPEFGVAHVAQLNIRYVARPLVVKHEVMVIYISGEMENLGVYDAARYAWFVRKKRAEGRLVLAEDRGVVVGVFKPVEWIPASKENFPELWQPSHVDSHKKKAFLSTSPVSEDVRQLYLV